MHDPLVLDTCVFNDKNFLFKLGNYHGQKILPAVAYTELCVLQIGKKHKTQEYVDHFLNKLDIKVEWYEKRVAQNAALFGIKGGDFRQHDRDYMIGAHAYPPPRTMITNNKKHFWFVSKVYTPNEFLKLIKQD